MADNYYERNLRHIARPDHSSERAKATKVLMTDYEALYLARALESYAHYKEDTDEKREIALGYVEYIMQNIRVEKRRAFPIYVHTDVAHDALFEALNDSVVGFDPLSEKLLRYLRFEVGEHA